MNDELKNKFDAEEARDYNWYLSGAPATAFNIPMIDISKEAGRHVIVAQGTEENYKGHPTTLLMPDGKTMFCAYPLGHGGPAAVLRRSDDGGLSWTDPLSVPANWKTANNCPSLYRFVGPDNIERLFVFEGNGKMRQAMSVDGGKTWTPFEENGLKTVMPFTSILPISQNRLLGAWNRDETWLSISKDGGLTWGPERLLVKASEKFPEALLGEPVLVRSPDEKQIVCLMRESSRRFNSLAMFSDNEGESWTDPVEVARALTGDRHQSRYASDGRLVMVFRDRAAKSPTWGHFVAWVGSYDDIRNRKEGQYRIKLLHSYDKTVQDCGYPGLELLPDDTFVATTYIKYKSGPEKQSVVSVRFKLAEIDAIAQMTA